MTNSIENSKTQTDVVSEVWTESGYPVNRDLKFWVEAESRLRAAAEPVAALPVAHLFPASSIIVRKAANVPQGLVRTKSSKRRRNVARF